MTAVELGRAISRKEIKPEEALGAVYGSIAEKDKSVNAYISLSREQAEAQLRAGGEDGGLLRGVPVSVKDNICTKGVLTSCASRILSNYLPVYDATAVAKVKAAGMPICCAENSLASSYLALTARHRTTQNSWH